MQILGLNCMASRVCNKSCDDKHVYLSHLHNSWACQPESPDYLHIFAVDKQDFNDLTFLFIPTYSVQGYLSLLRYLERPILFWEFAGTPEFSDLSRGLKAYFEIFQFKNVYLRLNFLSTHLDIPERDNVGELQLRFTQAICHSLSNGQQKESSAFQPPIPSSRTFLS